MKYKVGDIVKTNHGIGKIVEVKDVGMPYLVYHEVWSNGHNGEPFGKGKYTGNHCLWYFEYQLEPAEITSNLTINTTGIEISKSVLAPHEIKFRIMPDRYIINKGATILFWADGTKTIVKRSKDDEYNKRLGFLTAYFQKTSGMSKSKANKYLDSLIEEGSNSNESSNSSRKIKRKSKSRTNR